MTYGGAIKTILFGALGLYLIYLSYTVYGPREPKAIKETRRQKGVHGYNGNQGDPVTGQRKTSKHSQQLELTEDHNPVLMQLRQQGRVVLPSKDVLKTMSADALFKTYHSYIDNVDVICHRKLRMGNIGDGGWEICDDAAYRPKKSCLIYSFGINNDFSFDDDAARVYQCQVISFDPSMKQKSYQRSPLVYFSKIGISGENTKNKKSWELHTLGQIKNQLNHTGKVIDVLKMDVEYAEWKALPEMIHSGEMRQIRQFLVEFHGYNMDYTHLSILKDIYDIGFRKFYIHKNPACRRPAGKFPVTVTHCYEVHYVNINTP